MPGDISAHPRSAHAGKIWRAPGRMSYSGRDGRRRGCAFSRHRIFDQGDSAMGDSGKKDKGKREKRKSAQLTPKEKRKQKKEKKQNK